MNKHILYTPVVVWLLLGILIVASLGLWASGADGVIYRWTMANFSATELQNAFGILARMGQLWFQLIICAVMAAIYWRKKDKLHMQLWLYGGVLIPTAIGALNKIAKFIIGRPRPKMLAWYDMYAPQWFEFAGKLNSYPSGHTITTFALLGVVWSAYPRARWLLLLAAIIISIGGRMGIGAHFAGDVLAGAALGWVLGHAAAQKWIYKK